MNRLGERTGECLELLREVLVLPHSAMRLTSTLPTTAPSACCATVRACSGVEMPKPTQMGSVVCLRRRSIRLPMLAATCSCMPVTPSRET